MAKFSFKSSGKTQQQITDEEVTSSQQAIGILTPLSLGNNEILTMSYSLADQVHDNLRNLLLTNWGERVCLYDFGGNLRPLMTELVSNDDFDTEAVNRIKSAVGRWMPFIDLEDFVSDTVRTDNANTAVKSVTITYNIPALAVVGKQLQLFLYAI